MGNLKKSVQFAISHQVVVGLLTFMSLQTLCAQINGADINSQVRTEEESCISTLRTINVAQASYQGGNVAKGFARTLTLLGPSGEYLIDEDIASGKKDGYRFRLTPERKSADSPINHYRVTARPIMRLSSNQRSFYTDESHVIRFTTENRNARISDPILGPTPVK